MRSVSENLADIRSRIGEACSRSERDPGQVRLIAVTKTFPASACAEAFEAGIQDLGENYPQELREKEPLLGDATWHFLGPLQAGTVRYVADHADWIHTLAPGPALDKAGRRAVAAGRTVAGLVQVDFAGRGHGVASEDLEDAVLACSAVPGIEVAGLMTLPPVTGTAEQARPFFARLRQMRDDLQERHPDVQELSMGMSLDYEVAIEEGATMVRIGTALFGVRDKR